MSIKPNFFENFYVFFPMRPVNDFEFETPGFTEIMEDLKVGWNF